MKKTIAIGLIQDFENHLKEKGYSRKTIASYRGEVVRFSAWLLSSSLSYEQLSYTDCLAFIQVSQQQGKRSKTINQSLRVLRIFYTCLGDQAPFSTIVGQLAGLKIRGEDRQELYNLWSREELDQLYAGYPCEGMVGLRNKCIVGMLVYQGLMSNELAALTVSDIDLQKGTVFIQGTRKSNERMLCLEGNQIAFIQRYILTARRALLGYKGSKSSNQLYLSKGKGHQLSNSLQRLVPSLRKFAPSMQNLRQIRSSVIAHWLSKDHIRLVQYKLGHKYVSSTQAYYQYSLENLQDQIEKRHPLNEGKEKK